MTAGLQSVYRIVNDMPRDKVILAKLKFGSLAAALAILFTTPAESRSGVIKAETYACTSWGAAHEYRPTMSCRGASQRHSRRRHH
jgi:hypothetical protein